MPLCWLKTSILFSLANREHGGLQVSAVLDFVGFNGRLVSQAGNRKRSPCTAGQQQERQDGGFCISQGPATPFDVSVIENGAARGIWGLASEREISREEEYPCQDFPPQSSASLYFSEEISSSVMPIRCR